ncbi:MAG: daptomycin-sensing surface protein LiaX [Alkalibacterium sp.]|uniref:Putative adhesin n=1 Tax=Alkalibacterium gilvum TaxID=1130080 RepID=A0A1H6SWR0_9LACT|nr:daptomycin-sensing surface protein LiaX [Alkalibacterium gilvum]MDN6728983.1 daptomycin-sensing surface protein LiaX [Alkalibacterium sp.]SEI70254.1 Putative adhesin [Alkalibacterium gilvum]
MSEKERIIDLMKKGILSTEEGLDLLENTINAEGKKVEEEEFTADVYEDPKVESAENEAEQDKDKAEIEIEELVKEINAASVKLDTLNQQLSEVNSELDEEKAELERLMEDDKNVIKDSKEVILEEISFVKKELELIKQLDEVDNTEEIISLRNKIDQLSEQLDQVEITEEQTENDSKKQNVKNKINALEKEKDELKKEKEKIAKELNRSKVKQWTLKAKQATARFEMPDNWKKETNEEISKASKKIEEAGKEISSIFKKKVDQASDGKVRESIRSSVDNVLDNFDWKNVNLKFPTLATQSYHKEWTLNDFKATIVDVKVANGKILIEKGQTDSVSISAKGKLYGKMSENTPKESFEARSTVSVDDDKMRVHVPNKRVYVDLKITLPEIAYDYLSINTLNGKIQVDDLNVQDVFVKSTNGSIVFNHLKGTMLEAKGSNGSITVKKSQLKDLLANTVNGSVVYEGELESGNLTTTNGDVKISFKETGIKRLKASSVNGNVKLAIPDSMAIDGEAKTTFGEIKSRLSNTEIDEQSEKTKKFKRINDKVSLDFNLSTTTGNVLLKDIEKTSERE